MYNLFVVLGPTASGKTKLAAHLAHAWDTEIISADSRQVYRGMDIGTGKDLSEYVIDDVKIPVHLIDIQDAGASYHVAEFQKDFQKIFEDMQSRDKVPILCGGTGMYIEAVLQQYEYTYVPVDPSLRNMLEAEPEDKLLARFHEIPSAYTPLADISTRKRLIRSIEISEYLRHHTWDKKEFTKIKPRIIGLFLAPEERRKRITQRLNQRLQQGMIEEVEALLENGISPDKLVFYGLEYKFITQYLLGQMPYPDMVEKLNIAIHQFAKRQMTYFRHMERKGIAIHWLDALQPVAENIQEIDIIEWNQ